MVVFFCSNPHLCFLLPLSSYRFMLYHLMQAPNGKDITLHVSANNPAMVRCIGCALFEHPVCLLRGTSLLLFCASPPFPSLHLFVTIAWYVQLFDKVHDA